MKNVGLIEIASQINTIYLRKGFIEQGDYTITLFFLHIFREEVLKKDRSFEDAASTALNGDLSSKDLDEVRKCFTVLDFFTKEDIIDIFQDFSKLDQYELRNNFATVFERFFNYLTGLIDFKNGAFVLHPKMLNLIMEIADVQSSENIYNPFASNATLGTILKETDSYYGQEYNERIWRIGKLRLLAHDKPNSFSYVLESSITNWDDTFAKYDLVFSRLPFLNKVSFPDFEKYDFENIIIKKSISSVKKGGKIILLLKSSFLISSKSTNRELFKDLVDKNLLEKILFFPIGSFRHTTVHCNVLVLNTSKTDNSVDFIDLSEYLEKYKSRKGIVDWDTFNLANYLFDPWKAIKIDNKKIISKNYNLNIHSYFFEEIYSGNRLAEYVDITTGKKIEDNNYPDYIVKVRHLDDYNFKEELKLEKLEITTIRNIENYRRIEQRGVLVSSIGNKLKPTYFDGSTSVLIPNHIFLLRIKNTNVLTVKFLIFLLNTNQVKKQIEAFNSSSIYPNISRNNLNNIIVDVPSKENQERILDESYEKKIRDLSQEYSVIQKKISEEIAIEVSESNSVLRHKIAGSLSNLVFYAENIQAILEKIASKEFPEILDLKLNDKQLFSIGELLSKLLSDSKFITNEIKNQTQDLNVFEYSLKEINIVSWLDNYVNMEKHKHPNIIITFQVDFEESENVKVMANEDLLMILFDNLFRNIYKHAFSSNFDATKRIELSISLDSEDQLLTIFISNTGNPLPSNFNMEDYGRKGIKFGETSGNGIGGFFVKSIINYFNGEWYITDETGSEGLPDTDLATTFEVTLPYSFL